MMRLSVMRRHTQSLRVAAGRMNLLLTPLVMTMICMISCGSGEEDNIKGNWCRYQDDHFKFMIFDGGGTYSILEGGGTAAAAVETLINGESYELLEEADFMWLKTWISGTAYANRMDKFVPGEQLFLYDKNNGVTLYYYYMGDYDPGFDFAGATQCPPE